MADIREEVLAILEIVKSRDVDLNLTTAYDGKVELYSGRVSESRDTFSIVFTGVKIQLWYNDVAEIGFSLSNEPYYNPVLNIKTRRV
jgi:hypothetical protein